MVSTAMSLYDATQERSLNVAEDDDERSPTKAPTRRNDPEYTAYDKISFLHYKDLDMNLISYDFHDLEQESNPFLTFLQQNNCSNLASFLLTYLR